ncbi:hypothetical protein ONS95_007187 [Cadophora gregata]|uniref:uncharacterized protein n=1 Tax=Cadophora gregata TaxID=51156 RepID=UPI0026DB3257|nr:uncharacterized protein ONS95_007187 [Cadophora gregata]KAK0100737.1 hypothetical protein ONS95_007187 [Cadophora gregata]KAK0117267.1 hypothetical protein ONS96_013100 [Cadophora gregata f. sp. sojae]
MCHFEYVLHGCGHKGPTSAVICRHMAKVVKPKVYFRTMPFVKMATWVRVCTEYWGEKSTHVSREEDTLCYECILKGREKQVLGASA